MNAADWVPVADLVAWDKNPKPHGQDNIKEIARSIRRFDFGAPIVAWRSKRQVVAGHGRLLGASLLMREDPGRLLATDAPGPGLVPVRWMEFASESEAAAYALADNRLTEVNPMTDAAVADILREIEAEGGDVNIPGYSEDDLKALLAPDVADVPDPGAEEPAPQGEPDSKSGEVYELGPHRLVCGDNEDQSVSDALFVGARPLAVVTDPPYGIGIDGQKQSISANPKHNRKAHEFRGWDSKRPSQSIFGLILAFGVPTLIWGGNYFADLLPASRGWVYWSKGQDGLSMSDGELAWTNQHKPLRSVTVNRAALQGSQHPTQKPLQVIVFSLEYIEAGQVVFDPFGGSGTTLIACAQTGRVARLIEIDPRYCDVIRRRWTKWAREAGVDPGPGRLE